MILNNFEIDIKSKCIEERKTQENIAEIIGTTSQYVNRLTKNGGMINKTFVKIMEALGYDIKVTYVRREE